MKKCMKVAGQASYSFYKRWCIYFHIEAEEVKAESLLAMAEAMTTYEPNRGRTLESWVVYIVKRHLRKKFLKVPWVHRVHLDDFDNLITDHYDMERSLLIKEALNDLSPLSKEMFDVILNGNLVTKDDNKNTIKREVKKLLRSRGYSIQRIKSALHELKTVATMPI